VIFRGQFAKLVQCRCFLTLFPSLHVFDGDIRRLRRIFKRYLGAIPRPHEQFRLD
jgi:hypothetical protein